MDYVITNPTKKIYIRLNKNGYPETCSKQESQRTLKRFKFNVEAVSEFSNSPVKVLVKKDKEDCVQPESITRWVEKFGMCGDILEEAEKREKELLKELNSCDDELIDILHIVEIEQSKDMYNGWKIYKSIRENREKRRVVKDEILIVENVLRNIKNISCLHREQVQKAIDGLFNRKYTFRIVEEGELDENNAV